MVGNKRRREGTYFFGRFRRCIKVLCTILKPAAGYIMGVGAKLFTLAGPVIVYGTFTSVICCII
ncbi:MAG: SpoVA/SpoVAEb family sporulation membrane protein [Clostridia bacterium]|nr:SpoVA/SpoVAEb family sporulation membrane protein [Clostridia bacterium]